LVNMEVKRMFSRYARNWFSEQKSSIPETIQKFVSGILRGDAKDVSTILNKELLNDPSCYDFKEENSYHMFIYGILLAVSSDYTVYSNLESGKGRSDCLIKPHDKEKYAVVIEFKHLRGEPACSSLDPASSSPVSIDTLKAEAQKALKQIEDKAYIHNLKREGYAHIYKYGIAFHKKNCEVAMESAQLLNYS